MAIGAVRRLLSSSASSAFGGTSSVTAKSPVAFGFQRIESLVRPIGAIRTSFDSSSPLVVCNVTVVTYSRGSELSIVNGMRTDLPTTPNVGASRLRTSTSGKRVGAADGDGKHGNPLLPQDVGRLHRRLTGVPVAVGCQNDRSEVVKFFRGLGQRFVQVRATSRPRRRKSLDADREPPLQSAPRGRIGQGANRLAAGHRSGLASAGAYNVARVHAGRSVPQHGDRRLALGAKFFDPFRLIEEDDGRAHDDEAQHLERDLRRTIPAAAHPRRNKSRPQRERRRSRRPGTPASTET